MKINSVFFLVLFAAFLLAPITIRLCDHQADVTEFFSMNEEENVDTSLVDSEKLTQTTNSIATYQDGLNIKVFPISNVVFWDAFYLETSSPPPKV